MDCIRPCINLISVTMSSSSTFYGYKLNSFHFDSIFSSATPIDSYSVDLVLV